MTRKIFKSRNSVGWEVPLEVSTQPGSWPWSPMFAAQHHTNKWLCALLLPAGHRAQGSSLCLGHCYIPLGRRNSETTSATPISAACLGLALQGKADRNLGCAGAAQMHFLAGLSSCGGLLYLPPGSCHSSGLPGFQHGFHKEREPTEYLRCADHRAGLRQNRNFDWISISQKYRQTWGEKTLFNKTFLSPPVFRKPDKGKKDKPQSSMESFLPGNTGIFVFHSSREINSQWKVDNVHLHPPLFSITHQCWNTIF